MTDAVVTPPAQRDPSSSRWAAVFEAARLVPGRWMLVERPMRRSYAVQMASDIRNAHRRLPEQRIPGIRENERWEAKWEAPANDADDCRAWIRLVAEEGATETALG